MNVVAYYVKKIKWSEWLVSALFVILAAAMGFYLPQYGISYNLLLVVMLALVLVVLPSLAGTRQLKWCLFVGLTTFGLGLKGVYLGDIVSSLSLRDFVIYPAQILFWSLSGILLFRLWRRGIRTQWSLAIGWKVFLLGATLAVVIGLWRATASPGTALTRYFTYLTLIPVLFVTQQLITSWEDVRHASWFLIFTAFYVALFAVLEYYTPALFEPFRANFWSPTPTQVTSGGFERAVFSIWGNTVASNYLIWLLPFMLFFVAQYPERSLGLRLLGLVSVFICFPAVYISGNRSAWLITVLTLLAYTASQTRKGGFWLALLALLLAFKFLPDIQDHLIYATVIRPDTGTLRREDLWRQTWELILHNPLGSGWGVGPLAHNAFLQIAADAGVPTMIVFAWLLVRALRDLRRVSVKLAGTHLAS